MCKELLVNVDEETPMSILGPRVRVDWVNLGEGIYGDYNPEDPEDVNLLRFDVYKRRSAKDQWEEVEDASYCTRVEANTPMNVLERKLRIIYDRYADAIESDYDASVKKLGEELSWI